MSAFDGKVALVVGWPMNSPSPQVAQAFVPGLRQVASFDTTFHHTIPGFAQLFALPREMSAEAILRSGFHGLSCD
jgi:acetate kinase